MIHSRNSLKRMAARIGMRLSFLTLLLVPGISEFTGSALYAQTSIALPLLTYNNDGVQTLTPGIVVDLGQGIPEPTASIELLDGAIPVTLPIGVDVSPVDAGQGIYEIRLLVTSGQCVDVPAGMSDCTGSGCGGILGYSTAELHKCYKVRLSLNGAFHSDHFLCAYGRNKLQATGPSATVAGRNGNQYEINFSINRDEEHFNWKLDEAMPSYFTWDGAQGGDQVGKNAKLIFNAPSEDLAETTFHMTVTNDERACESSTVTFKVSSKGDAVFVGGDIEMVLVVDVSGSMGSTAICDCQGTPGCPDPPGKSKLKYLKEELRNLLIEMRELARTGDRIGLVSFHTTSTKETGMVPFADTTIDDKIGAWNDNGYDYTAIGLGLKDAVSMFSTSTTTKKYIILMTNGMQNESPLLQWTDGTKTTVKVGSTVFNSALGITVIPIAIFTPSGEYRQLLNALGTATGVSVVKDVCESNGSLLQAYTDAAKSMGSPKLVTFRRGTFAGSAATGTFTVNENLDKMLVNIINVGNQNLTNFRIEKNISNTWTDITALGNILPAPAQASIKRLFTVSFPALLNGSPLNSSGEYRYTINSSIPNIPYELSVIIDDRGVKHSAYTSMVHHQAGEPLNLAASAFFNGQPITDANVTVSLEAPVASFSSKFSKAKIPGQYLEVTRVPLVEGRKGGLGMPYINRFNITHPALTASRVDADRMTVADKKYVVLKEQRVFNGAFESRGESVALTHQTKGIYKGKFTNTGRVGLYAMHYLIQGNVTGVGSVTRMDVKDVYINFGKPVLNRSKLYLMWEEPLVLSMTPMDGSGNLLGPGQGDQISVYMSKGSASVPTDYLDGRYVIRLFGINDSDDPDMIIRIDKDVLFNGKLSDIRRQRGFFSILGGYTFPQSAIDSTYRSSFTGELKLGYRFWKKWGAQAHLGYYSFKKQAGDPGLNTLGGGLGLFYRLPLSSGQGWNMIAEVNGGYYKPQDLDGAFGFNGGLGLNTFINYNLSLVVEGKYYSIATTPDKMNFFGGMIGLKFHFR